MKRSIKNRTFLRRCVAPALLALGLQIGAEKLLRAQTTANQSQLAILSTPASISNALVGQSPYLGSEFVHFQYLESTTCARRRCR